MFYADSNKETQIIKKKQKLKWVIGYSKCYTLLWIPNFDHVPSGNQCPLPSTISQVLNMYGYVVT